MSVFNRVLCPWTAVGIAVLGAAIATPVHAQDELALRGEHFFTMPELFDGFSFSVGEVSTLAPPNAASYRNLVVPTLDGRLRLGVQSTFLEQNHLRQTDAEKAQRKVDERLIAATDTYLGLLALDRLGDVVTDENMTFTETTGNRIKYFATEGGFQPRGFVAVLAMNLLQDEPYHRYFCNGVPGCIDAYRNHLQLGMRMQGAGLTKWGRNADEFAAQSAIEDFLASDMGVLKEWSATLSPELALVGWAPIPEYDFTKKGFALQLTLPHNSSPRTSDLRYFAHFAPDDPLRLQIHNGLQFNTFLPMEPSVAEGFIEEMAERRANFPSGVVYFLAEGRLLDLSVNMPEYRSGIDWVYTLTSGEVALFKDARLAEPLGSFEIEKQP